MTTGLYIKDNGDILEYYQGQEQAFNITRGRIEPVSVLGRAELLEEINDAE
jgi:hypothetical protein